jgi:transcriptional regulator with PAS, ATPase and Fis domain
MANSHDDRTAPEVQSAELHGADYRVHVLWEGGHARAWLSQGSTLLLGRADDCDIVVDHSSASRHHARIVTSPALAIVDLGSSNGVRVAGARIERHEPVTISPGDLIELGGSLVAIHPPATAERAAAPTTRSGAANVANAAERLLDLVAPAEINVLLLGETGVGKNVSARRIHDRSPRKAGPFVQVNCAALPEHLLESELFGYEPGAFTGAVRAKAGLCEAAHRGTLFLDEIGEMPLTTQAKLLGVLDNNEVQRLGSVKRTRVDVRFIAATNRDLEAAVHRGQFRRDLYFRLNAMRIELPPLRARTGTIPDLARLFAAETAAKWRVPVPTIHPEALSRLMSYDFPGNVRELKNVIERAFVLSQGKELAADHFDLRPAEPHAQAGPGQLPAAIKALERDQVIQALEHSGGNQTQAAKQLGIARRTLINRMEEYGLSRPRKR